MVWSILLLSIHFCNNKIHHHCIPSQCIPTWEMAYASNDRNADTISIECCHPDENGKFTDATYRSLVQLTAWLCAKYDLTADQVIRHYDVTGKICPKYFVEDEDAWVEFRRNVQDALEKQ